MREIRDAIGQYCGPFPQLREAAEEAVTIHTKLMGLFRKCHKGYNSAKFMGDLKIDQLGKTD